MYAFVSNEYRTIVYSQRQLELLMSLYSYPSFKRVESIAEAHQYFNQCNRDFIKSGLYKYGRKSNTGYISVEYFIDGNNIYCNVDTSNFGFIKLENLPNNVKQEATYDLLRLKICNVRLNDALISNHCSAISNIIRLFDDFIDIELRLPDISVYLACTKYKGTNYSIKGTQNVIAQRMGEVFYTVK